MREIDLDTAVREIVGTTRRKQTQIEKEGSGHLPFFFIVGAGISHPPIPLAEGIERLCQDVIQDTGGPLPPPDVAPLDRYARTFETAFPSAEERQGFLHDLLDKRPISPANLRLAHLLGERKLTNLVVTPNFDEMLSQALRLLGYHDIVICDHPKTTQRIRLNRTSQIQIVHVHGTHWFYDCCNLRGEIENRGKHDEQDELSMLALVERALGDRSPIVVGYSGWEGDVIMTALRRRLRLDALPHNVYWFCYHRTDAEALPIWLREHPSVRVAVPPPHDTPSDFSIFRLWALSSTEDAAGGAGSPVLHAASVFGALIKQLDLAEPRLAEEPLAFLGEQLEISLRAAIAEEDADLYLFREALRRVKSGVRFEELDRKNRSATHQLLAQVYGAVRRLSFRDAAQLARHIELSTLTPEEQEDLDSALDKLNRGVSAPDSDVGLLAATIQLDLAQVVSQQSDGVDWLHRTARALNWKGLRQAMLGRHVEAIASFEEVERRFGEKSLPEVREQVGFALRSKAGDLVITGDTVGALKTYEKLLGFFATASEQPAPLLVATTIFAKALLLAGNGEVEEGIAAYEELIRRFHDQQEEALRAIVARTLIFKAVVLDLAAKTRAADSAYRMATDYRAYLQLDFDRQVAFALGSIGAARAICGRSQEASLAFDEVVRRFGKAGEPGLRALVCYALLSKGAVARDQGQPSEAIAACNQAILEIGESPELALREVAIVALVEKGFALKAMGKIGEELDSYSEAIQRFGETPEPTMRGLVAWAKRCMLSRRDRLWRDALEAAHRGGG